MEASLTQAAQHLVVCDAQRLGHGALDRVQALRRRVHDHRATLVRRSHCSLRFWAAIVTIIGVNAYQPRVALASQNPRQDTSTAACASGQPRLTCASTVVCLAVGLAATLSPTLNLKPCLE